MAARLPRKRNKTARQLAEEFGIKPRTVRNHMAEPRDEFLDRAKDRRGEVFRLRQEGYSHREIAEMLSTSEQYSIRLYMKAKKERSRDS